MIIYREFVYGHVSGQKMPIAIPNSGCEATKNEVYLSKSVFWRQALSLFRPIGKASGTLWTDTNKYKILMVY